MIIGVPKEIKNNECRVGLTPKSVNVLSKNHKIYVQPINFPTVPRGTERLRFTPSPMHGTQEIDYLVRVMDELWSHCALNRTELTA